MTSVLSSVTNWLGGTREISPERTPVAGDNGSQAGEEPAPRSDVPVVAAPEVPAGDKASAEEGATEQDERPALDVDLHEVSDKAVQAAKEWGSMWMDVVLLQYQKYSTVADQI